MNHLIGKIFSFKNSSEEYIVQFVYDGTHPENKDQKTTYVCAVNNKTGFAVIEPLSVFIRDFHQIKA